MEIFTTVEEAARRIRALNRPPQTQVHIIIEEKQSVRQEHNLLQKIRDFKPIEVGDKDIVETIREERERLDTRNLIASYD